MRYSITLYFAFIVTFMSCTDDLMMMNMDHSPTEIFEEFWTYVDQKYIFFDQKGVDWDEVYNTYRRQVTEDMSEDELYNLCHRALLELKDGHNRIQTPEKYIRGYDFKEGYDIHFSIDLLQTKYAKGTFEKSGNLYYTIIDDIGYIYIAEMSQYGKFNSIVRSMKEEGVKGLIVDVRNNSGGDSNSVPRILSDFVTETTTLGYYIEKSGPDHDDVTEPLVIKAEPSSDFNFGLPVVVLINRASYSATSYLASMFSHVPGVTLVGQKTGGGAGGNLGYQLSNQWIVAVSVNDYVDASYVSIEPGVDPDIAIENTAERLEAGYDDMLEKSIEVIMSK